MQVEVMPNPTKFDGNAQDLLEWVRQVIALNTKQGFFAAYRYNLALYKNKALAYEETERVYEQYYQRRKYRDNEVFYSALSQFGKETVKGLPVGN